MRPLASLIVRKNTQSELHLQHHGIGDVVAKIYAASLKRLPLISYLNLKDNKLTDKGLSPLIRAIGAMPALHFLDLSRNVVDGRAAAALAKYLSLPNCPLRHLTINSADIDDEERYKFVEALSKNTTLETLNLGVRLVALVVVFTLGKH